MYIEIQGTGSLTYRKMFAILALFRCGFLVPYPFGALFKPYGFKAFIQQIPHRLRQLEHGRTFPSGSTESNPSQALHPLLPSPTGIGLNKHSGVGEYHINLTPASKAFFRISPLFFPISR